MKTKKSFDLGIYTFHRTIAGPLCPKDDQLTKEGTVFACLHPLQNVDPSNIYCFGVSKLDGSTKTLVRKNLKWSKIVTLTYIKEDFMSHEQEIWAKLNAAVAYFKEANPPQLAISEAHHRHPSSESMVRATG